MSPVVWAYLGYAVIGVALVAWVARTLQRYGEVFLLDVFDGHEDLARAVNRLLVIGFYLLNLGYVAFALRTSDGVDTARAAVELLSTKVGGVLLVLGVLHLGNVLVLSRVRRRRVAERNPVPPVPPVPPVAWTQVSGYAEMPGGVAPGGPGPAARPA